MKEINGEYYFSFQELCDKIRRSKYTVRNWYAWAEENNKLDLLPIILWFGEKRKARYFPVKASVTLPEIVQKESGPSGDWNEFSAATGIEVPPSNINKDANNGSGFIIIKFIVPNI